MGWRPPPQQQQLRLPCPRPQAGAGPALGLTLCMCQEQGCGWFQGSASLPPPLRWLEPGRWGWLAGWVLRPWSAAAAALAAAAQLERLAQQGLVSWPPPGAHDPGVGQAQALSGHQLLASFLHHPRPSVLQPGLAWAAHCQPEGAAEEVGQPCRPARVCPCLRQALAVELGSGRRLSPPAVGQRPGLLQSCRQPWVAARPA
ncbi:hypothetical protein V8C86DRAFT_761007 [Haematococcus lacustris]